MEIGELDGWNYGFEPVIDKDSKVLILGSFPSVKSRETGFYYGNKQNRFWKMLEATFNAAVPKETEGKKRYLFSHNIALYDVIAKCKIKGSSDYDINEENSVPVKIDVLLKTASGLKLIICNGKKAYEIFCKTIKCDKVPCVCLPSTSSANPSYSAGRWVETLKGALE